MIHRRIIMKKYCLVLCAAFALSGGPAPAATPAEDAAQANQLFQQGKVDVALPIYERLAAGDRSNILFTERLALCLYAMMEVQPAGKTRDELIARALREVERASDLGSKYPLLLQLETRLRSEEVRKPNPEQESLRLAEEAFTKGDFDAALAGYKAVAASNPRSYAAHLFAGDVYFKRGDLPAAAEWYGKAISIDPNKETAYRYWGDAISRSGDDKAALAYYIRAIVAEPYTPNPRTALDAWAKRNGARLQAPLLPRPVVGMKDEGTGKGPQPTINMDPSILSDRRAGAAWMAYATNRMVWMTEKFLERNPGATAYRHSLEEEVESLRLAVRIIEKEIAEVAQLPALRDLVRISQDNMLESYVLLNGVDAGIAQDYPAWRDAHREQLVAFIDKYIVIRAAAP